MQEKGIVYEGDEGILGDENFGGDFDGGYRCLSKFIELYT